MKGILLAAMVLSCCAVAGGALAFTDDFDSYATGPLSVVSGSVWGTWGGGSTDAQVVPMGLSAPNAMYHDGIASPDVVSYWPDVFGSASLGVFSFDFLVHEEGNDDMESYLLVGSGNPGVLNTNYASALGIFIFDFGASPGVATLHFWDIDGAAGGGDYGLPVLDAGLALDVWHHVELYAALVVADPRVNPPGDADGVFEIWLNGLPVLGPTPFGLDDPLGWNATEVYSFDAGGANAEQNDYHLFDSLVAEAVPEPGLIALGGMVLLVLVRRRK
ncbi:MAG: hypothetical protein JW889_09155 [Verrucomicrobia bacterium]|nr:hypothetical protein [Verrucomicrobiota bacterium]